MGTEQKRPRVRAHHRFGEVNGCQATPEIDIARTRFDGELGHARDHHVAKNPSARCVRLRQELQYRQRARQPNVSGYSRDWRGVE